MKDSELCILCLLPPYSILADALLQQLLGYTMYGVLQPYICHVTSSVLLIDEHTHINEKIKNKKEW